MGEGDGSRKDAALGFGLQVVEALAAAGLVAVPLTPTADMLQAGAAAAGVSTDGALRMWRAMIGTA